MPRGVSCKYRVQTQRCRNNGDWNVCSVNSVEFWAGDGSLSDHRAIPEALGSLWGSVEEKIQDFLMQGEEQQQDP